MKFTAEEIESKRFYVSIDASEKREWARLGDGPQTDFEAARRIVDDLEKVNIDARVIEVRVVQNKSKENYGTYHVCRVLYSNAIDRTPSIS